MIGQTAWTHGDRSVAAAISTAAIAATVTGKDDAGIAGTIVLARLGVRLAPGIAGGPEQGGHHHRDDRNHPENYLAQILTPSAVDTLKGNRR